MCNAAISWDINNFWPHKGHSNIYLLFNYEYDHCHFMRNCFVPTFLPVEVLKICAAMSKEFTSGWKFWLHITITAATLTAIFRGLMWMTFHLVKCWIILTWCSQKNILYIICLPADAELNLEVKYSITARIIGHSNFRSNITEYSNPIDFISLLFEVNVYAYNGANKQTC